MIPGAAIDRAARMRLDGYEWDTIKLDLQVAGYGDHAEKDIKDAVYVTYPNLKNMEI